MPRFDGTGPWGSGPGTGWGKGPCGAGMGWRRGRRIFGRGFGWRRFWNSSDAPQSKKEEADALSEEAAVLQQELDAIKAHLAELNK